MNKIKIVNDNLEMANVSDDIKVEYYEKECLFAISEIKINILKSTKLNLEINLKSDSKIALNINLNDNVNLDLSIISTGVSGKIQYEYILNENSICNIEKFQNIGCIKEKIIARLQGHNANINYNFKTIASGKECYDYYIFHDFSNTISNIKNNGVCINDGIITYQVSSFVPPKISDCIVNQNNRIINLTNNKCEIKPILYIDCDEISASHSAHIGKFSDDEIFYLQSRGIDYNSALKLLISGFLKSDISNKKLLTTINKNIDSYWR